MLTDKEIKNLEKSTKKWIPKVLLFGSIFYIVIGLWHLYFIQRIVSKGLYSWEKVLTPETFDINKSYSGIQVFIESQLQSTILMFGASVIFFIFYITSKQKIKYNLLLLSYIKKEQNPNKNASPNGEPADADSP